MLLIVFGAVMMVIVMYTIILFSLKLTGVKGVVTGLIPSVGLFAASWYIKKRLHREDQCNSSADSEVTGRTVDEL